MPENDAPDSVLGKLRQWADDGEDQAAKGGLVTEVPLSREGDNPLPVGEGLDTPEA